MSITNLTHLQNRFKLYEEIYELRLTQYNLGAYNITDLLSIEATKLKNQLEASLQETNLALLQSMLEVY